MKKILLILMTLASVAMADEWDGKRRLNEAIYATRDARETLMKDLHDADQGIVRMWYTGCPTLDQFNKILEDEKRYNEAARRWLKEMGDLN